MSIGGDKLKKNGKRGIFDSLQESELLQQLDNKMQHSSYYHKRYEGYMEKAVTDTDGKKHIERVYIREYYNQELTDKNRIRVRILYSVLYFLAAVLFLYASVIKTGSNLEKHIQFISFLTAVSMLAMLVFLITYIAGPKKMTIWQYYSGPVRVKGTSLIISVLMFAQAIAAAVFVITSNNSLDMRELINIAIYSVAAIMMLLIFIFEKKITYKKTMSDTTFQRGGYYIDF